MEISVKNIIRIIGVEFKKELSDWKLYVSLIGYVLLCFYISGDYGNPNNALHLIDVMIALSNTASLLVVLAALPSACTFSDDWENGYYKFIVGRSSAGQYITAKILTCAISTFLIAFVGFSIFGVIMYMMVGGSADTFDETFEFYSIAAGEYRIIYIFIRAAVLAVVTVVFAEYGLMGSAIMPNRFTAMAFPLVSTVILIEFSSKFRINNVYLHNIEALEFHNQYAWPSAIFTIILYLFVANIIFAYFVKRRIRCEIN